MPNYTNIIPPCIGDWWRPQKVEGQLYEAIRINSDSLTVWGKDECEDETRVPDLYVC